MFNGNLSAECAVHPPSSKVAAIPDEAIWFCDWMRAIITEMRNVFPVPVVSKIPSLEQEHNKHV